MEIQVGEYVRTTEGTIIKVEKKHVIFDMNNKTYIEIYNANLEEEIKKHSFNPIDLIEEGDYVNGVMVESMNNSIRPTPIPQYKNEYGEYVDFDESDIKSIVTKEQFENITYKL